MSLCDMSRPSPAAPFKALSSVGLELNPTAEAPPPSCSSASSNRSALNASTRSSRLLGRRRGRGRGRGRACESLEVSNGGAKRYASLKCLSVLLNHGMYTTVSYLYVLDETQEPAPSIALTPSRACFDGTDDGIQPSKSVSESQRAGRLGQRANQPERIAFALAPGI